MVGRRAHVPRPFRRGQPRERQLLSDRPAGPGGIRLADRPGPAAAARQDHATAGLAQRVAAHAGRQHRRPRAGREQRSQGFAPPRRRRPHLVLPDGVLLDEQQARWASSATSRCDRSVPASRCARAAATARPTADEVAGARRRRRAVPEAKAAVTRALGDDRERRARRGRKTDRAAGDPAVFHRGPSTGNQVQPADGAPSRAASACGSRSKRPGAPVWTGALLDRNGTKTWCPSSPANAPTPPPGSDG